ERLGGGIAGEGGRGPGDVPRRGPSQMMAREKRLADARLAAEGAENEYNHCRLELQAAQDRRLRRQQTVGTRRLEASQAEHELALAEERVRSQAALVEVARIEQAELTSRLSSATELRDHLAPELAEAEAQLANIPPPPPPPPAGDAEKAREAAREADRARKMVVEAETSLASVRGRLRFQEESLDRLNRQVLSAEAELPEAEAAA